MHRGFFLPATPRVAHVFKSVVPYLYGVEGNASTEELANHPVKGKTIMAQKKTTAKGIVTSKSGITEDVILPYLYHSIKKTLAFRDRVVQDTAKITVHTDLNFRKVTFIFFDKNGEVITIGGISTNQHTVKNLLADMGALSATITRFQLEPRAMNAVEIMIYEMTA